MKSTQFEILDHTLHRAARNAFAGVSPAMIELIALGYMRSLGKPSWSPDEYFTITPAGREAYEMESLNRRQAKCKHEHLTEEGTCRGCGADCRGIGGGA